MKINRESVKQAYTIKDTVLYYTKAVFEIGLWKSEKILIKKYTKSNNDKILDVGCGAGRIAIGLYESGYHNIAGIDLSKPMIENARKIAKEKGYPILFYEGDAVNPQFQDEAFDIAIFSFNGLMLIPGIENRIKAILEIKRILKPGGHFIFTTHDRDMQNEWDSFWEKEKTRWSKGEQNPSLFDFGDRIIKGKAEETFLHFPDHKEIIYSLKKGGLIFIEDIWRSDLSDESDEVKKFSYSCRFWVAQRPSRPVM